MWNRTDASLLNAQTGMNPVKPEDATYYDARQTAIVLRKLGGQRLIVATTYGTTDWEVGSTKAILNDRTARFQGEYEVVGIRSFATGETLGTVPAKKLAHWVFK